MKVNKVLTSITQSKPLNNHFAKVINDDTYAAKALVVCSVAKDVFAYATRFKTTMNNEKIPQEKRPFVAAMDLSSGIVTAIAQISVGFCVANKKLQDGIWNKLFSNVKFNDIKLAKKGFVSILTLATTGILTERVLVPLLATLLAEKVEKKTK